MPFNARPRQVDARTKLFKFGVAYYRPSQMEMGEPGLARSKTRPGVH